eukprot:3941313-Rhodomonas_salina.2
MLLRTCYAKSGREADTTEFNFCTRATRAVDSTNNVGCIVPEPERDSTEGRCESRFARYPAQTVLGSYAPTCYAPTCYAPTCYAPTCYAPATTCYAPTRALPGTNLRPLCTLPVPGASTFRA